MSAFYSACPVVDRTSETFFQHVMVGGQSQNLPFTREILWLQRSEAQIRLIHGGQLVSEGGVYCDGRYLTSFENLDPQGWAAHFSVTPESSLEIVVSVSILQQPVLEPRGDDIGEAYGSKIMNRYDTVPRDWRQMKTDDGQTLYPMLVERKLGEGVIWSSKNTPEQNDALKRAFIEKWSVEAVA